MSFQSLLPTNEKLQVPILPVNNEATRPTTVVFYRPMKQPDTVDTSTLATICALAGDQGIRIVFSITQTNMKPKQNNYHNHLLGTILLGNSGSAAHLWGLCISIGSLN